MKMKLPAVILLLCFAGVALAQPGGGGLGNDDDGSTPHGKKRIAIIGGGIGGTFTARYLSQYDSSLCYLDSIVVFDPSPMLGGGGTTLRQEAKSSTDEVEVEEEKGEDGSYWQGSRVASVTLSDGTVVELGASVAYSGNRLLLDMVDGDPKLELGKPFNPGEEKEREEEGKWMPTGFGIYDGNGTWPLLLSNLTSIQKTIRLFYRYNTDLLKINSACSRAVESFERVYEFLESDRPESFFESPDEMWHAVGLLKPIRMSFDAFLDAIGVAMELPWWKSIIPHQGLLRNELIAAASFCNYNQLNSELNGLVGLGSFLPTKGELFSIVGGNHKLLSSAMNQARLGHAESCSGSRSDSGLLVRHIRKKVTRVVSDLHWMELWSEDESLGQYDVVILATPLQQSRITFLIRSHVDGAVLQPMPLGGMVDSDAMDGSGDYPRPPPLPSSASRRYVQVVSTVIGNATIQHRHFNLSEGSLPRSIYVTERGRELEGINAITQITSDGVFKVFSSERLSTEYLVSVFGSGHSVEYVKVWGGPHGGATPDYNAAGEGSAGTNYLLYDAGLGTKGHGEGPALYYVNSVEASFACLELVAVGAKSVAKLVARRLGLIGTKPHYSEGEL